MLELFEHYLIFGSLPFWAPGRSQFSFEQLFIELTDCVPNALTELLFKHGKRRHALERLAFQLPPESLERLAELLEPRHCRLIIGYIEDIRRTHLNEPVVNVHEQALTQALWLVAEVFLLRDPGTQFNRKSFARSLIHGIAETWSVNYRQALSTIHRGLERLAKKQPLSSSLPAVLVELVREDEVAKGEATELPGTLADIDSEPKPERSPSIANQSRVLFECYDALDTIFYFLRFGWLPWHALAQDPNLDEERALAPLAHCSRSQLATIFPRHREDKRQAALRRAVLGLSETDLAGWVERLLPPAARPADSPLRTALADFSAQAEDRPLFFARLLIMLLDGEALDFEQLMNPNRPPDPASPLPPKPENWPVQSIKSALLSFEVRKSTPQTVDRPSTADLLEALLDKYPEDAKQLLAALNGRSELYSKMLHDVPAQLFDRVMTLLCPQEADSLQSFSQLLADIPAPWRPSSEAVRRAVFSEALEIAGGKPLDPSGFARILTQLFPAPLPLVVQRVVDRHEIPEKSADLGSAQRAHARNRQGAASNGQPNVTGMAVDANVRDAVFAFLRGKGAKLTPTSAGARPNQPPSKPQTGRSQALPLPRALSKDGLRYATRILIEESPNEVYDFIRHHTADPRTRRHWVKTLPESTLVRLSYLLEPRRHRVLLDTAEVLTSAWLETAPAGLSALTRRSELWSFLLEFLAQNQGTDRFLERLVTAYFGHFATRYRSAAPTTDALDTGSHLFQHALDAANKTGNGSLLSTLRSKRSDLLAAWDRTQPKAPAKRRQPPKNLETNQQRTSAPKRSRPIRSRTSFGLAEPGETGETGEPTDAVYIDNAGLVLTAPFLPHLFQSLGMLEIGESGQNDWLDRSTASRAVHLLQNLVDGHTSAPEPLLVLNKILCGVPTAAAVERSIDPTDQELESCGKVLQSIIAHWPAIANTSVSGLRETFLEREGRLHKSPEGWRLRVQRKTLDVLVDQIPWSLSVVLHDWMPQPLYVTW